MLFFFVGIVDFQPPFVNHHFSVAMETIQQPLLEKSGMQNIRTTRPCSGRHGSGVSVSGSG